MQVKHLEGDPAEVEVSPTKNDITPRYCISIDIKLEIL